MECPHVVPSCLVQYIMACIGSATHVLAVQYMYVLAVQYICWECNTCIALKPSGCATLASMGVLFLCLWVCSACVYGYATLVSLTVSTENATPPKSTISRHSHVSVQIQIKPKFHFGFVPQDIENSEFVDLVDLRK